MCLLRSLAIFLEQQFHGLLNPRAAVTNNRPILNGVKSRRRCVSGHQKVGIKILYLLVGIFNMPIRIHGAIYSHHAPL